MLAHPAAAPERHELWDIAYGFMASKALFAALELDLFSRLAGVPRSCEELSADTGTAVNRLQTLLHALTGLGLLRVDDGCYTNAPVASRWLVHGAPDDYGDYFRLQIARQIYPALLHLDEGLAGTGPVGRTLPDLLADPAEARTFTDGQHVGSLRAAQALAGRLPLVGQRRLLDVGGGSGAFSIALCARHPGLRSTLLDLPAVVDVASGYVAGAGLAARIGLLPGDARTTPWPGGQDVVLMSYLLSALADDELDGVLERAMAALRPGGLLVLHDFMLDDAGSGPPLAALWFLQYLAHRGNGVSFSAADLRRRVRRHGFLPTTTQILIPGITKVVLARKQPVR